MNLNEVIYVDSLPTLDLHGLDRDTARVKIIEFINDNKVMGNEIICIIHGIGDGILKEEAFKTLKHNKNIINYKLFYNNTGCTIAKLNIDI